MSESGFNRDEFDARQYFRNLSEAAKEQAFLMALAGDEEGNAFLHIQVTNFKKLLSFKIYNGGKRK